MEPFLARLLPFMFLGILTVLTVVGIILFSYLLIFGAAVGFILFVVAWIKGLFTRKNQRLVRHKQGRIIEHE
jgi:hypothetical protein